MLPNNEGTKMLFKKVTNNVVDVFFGKEGFQSKEWVRVKRAQGTWSFSGTRRVHQDEIDYGCVTELNERLQSMIIGELNVFLKKSS